MKIEKVIKWFFLYAVSNLSAQNNFSAEFMINSQPSQELKMSQVYFGLDYCKTFHSKYRIENELKFDTKDINYLNKVSYSETTFIGISNKFSFSYLKSDRIHINFKLEPYVASENNLKIAAIDLLGEVNVDLILSSNTKLTIGASRNNFFGKTMVLPLFTYYYEFNKDVIFKIGFPESKLSYSNTIRNLFSLKNTFNGSSYNLANNSKLIALNSTKASFSQLTTALEYERNMDRNWYVTFELGYDFNKKYLLLDNNYDTTLNLNIKDGYQFGLTIKYKQ